MKYAQRLLGLALATSFISGCTLGPSNDKRFPASAIEAGDYRVRELTNERILKLSSTENLKIGELKILTDNTDALESKIDIIRKAKSEIVMMYYIFSVDESSSYLSRELLKAATERNVKVKILVDFFVNYKNYDHFRMLEEKSNGNIQVSFYGVPQGALLESMSYLVYPCEEQNKACVAKKWAAIKQQHDAGKVPFFTKLFVAGLYGKTPDLAKIGLSEGAQLDLSGTDKVSPEEKAQLLEFLELVFKAKVKGDIGAKMKLAMALAFYGADTLPIYEKLLAVFPLVGGDKQLARYWENATDFIHHKLIVADSKYVQLGGRNVEDSYHMAVSPAGKYTFLDTDVYAEVLDGGDDIRESYDKMWNFSDSVKSLKNLDSVATHNFIAKENLAPLVMAIKKCEPFKKKPEYATCIESSVELKVSIGERVKKAEENLLALSSAYDAKKIVNSKPTALVMNDPSPLVTYVENLSFTKKSQKRLFGSDGDKNISHLWVEAIKNTCKIADEKNPQEITLLNAYVFMPAAIYSTIGDALTGKLRCSYTTFIIATNSVQTTDLNAINVLATYQFLSLAKAADPKSKVKLRILEMNRPNQKTTYSLHTKASIFGSDLIIGSANADIRSYHMDTNNGFFIRNAPQLTTQYKAWVADFIKTKFADKTAQYRGLTFAQAQSYNGQAFDQLLAEKGKKISQGSKVKIKKLFLDTCKDIYEDSQFFLSRQLQNMDERQRQQVLQPRIESFDSKYQIF